ncbi:MAG TPA: TonB-dependent receptor plug domain-containing protein, partial [Polyangia bacterium]
MPLGAGSVTRDGRGTAASTIRPFLSRALLRGVPRGLALVYVTCAAGGWGGGAPATGASPVELEAALDPGTRSAPASEESAAVEGEPEPQAGGSSSSEAEPSPASIADPGPDPSQLAAAPELPAHAPPPVSATASLSDSEGAAPAPASEEPPYQSLVTASRFEPSAAREDVAATSSVIIPAESPRARDDLGSLLLEVPGANVTRRGGLGSFASLSLRGSNPDEVRIYVDGVPLNQAVGGAVDLSTLPLGDVERVEIYRGSTPIGFGESALGGVVSIVTRTPGGPAAVTLRGGAGSFRTTFADATAAGAIGPLRLYAGVHALRAAGDFPDAPPDVPGGYQPPRRENDDLSQMDGVLRAALSLRGRRELRLGALGIWRDQGLPAQNIFESQARAATSRALLHLDYESRDDLGESSRFRVLVFGAATREAFVDPMHQIAVAPTATHDVT